ncbi:MAG TPA: ABC transporter permease [Aestuariivirgaceae bacterium]|jgi:spermidine/putrescine transport system permease protein|nr:ABC transporter permease [Aestuariivirgaceae bacterium]
MTGLRLSHALWAIFAIAVSFYLVAPLALVILFSFNSSALTSLPLTGLTFDWYRRLMALDYFWPALQNSLTVALAVGALSVIIGTLAALAVARMPGRRAERIIGALSLPMMMPALIIGIALLSTFVRLLTIRLGIMTVILGQLVVVQPFVIAIVYARLQTFDWAVVDSARDLGASPLAAFFTVTLPIVQPTIVGATLIALAISLDDFVITFFTIGSGNTLPTMVWGLVRTSLDPTINALATLLIAFSIGSTVIALWLSRYRG